MDTSEMTYMVLEGVWTCNNCGAYEVVFGNELPKNLKHHKTCKKGEAKHWEEFYSEEDDEEDKNKNWYFNH